MTVGVTGCKVMRGDGVVLLGSSVVVVVIGGRLSFTASPCRLSRTSCIFVRVSVYGSSIAQSSNIPCPVPKVQT